MPLEGSIVTINVTNPYHPNIISEFSNPHNNYDLRMSKSRDFGYYITNLGLRVLPMKLGIYVQTEMALFDVNTGMFNLISK